MSALVSTVWVHPEKGGEMVSFGPDDENIPAWALEQMGDHCFENGERPDADEATSYSKQNKEQLQAEIDSRNEGRDDEKKIVVEGKGNKPDLVKALEADDAAQAD